MLRYFLDISSKGKPWAPMIELIAPLSARDQMDDIAGFLSL
jgi:hypothetical protein